MVAQRSSTSSSRRRLGPPWGLALAAALLLGLELLLRRLNPMGNLAPLAGDFEPVGDRNDAHEDDKNNECDQTFHQKRTVSSANTVFVWIPGVSSLSNVPITENILLKGIRRSAPIVELFVV